MRHSLVLLLLICFLSPILSADEDAKARTKASGRIEAAGTVLDEIEAAPDQRIPEEVLGSAECVAVVPSLLKGGFVVGGRYGKGVASCRTKKAWAAPPSSPSAAPVSACRSAARRRSRHAHHEQKRHE